MKYWLINLLPVDCDIIHLLKQTFMLVNRRELKPPDPEQFTMHQSKWLIDGVLYTSSELTFPLRKFHSRKKNLLYYTYHLPPYYEAYLRSFKVSAMIISTNPLIIQLGCD